eukprot:COSAG01_NODE_5391_length_4291_cov_3.036021_3_plen_89_part_00
MYVIYIYIYVCCIRSHSELKTHTTYMQAQCSNEVLENTVEMCAPFIRSALTHGTCFTCFGSNCVVDLSVYLNSIFSVIASTLTQLSNH